MSTHDATIDVAFEPPKPIYKIVITGHDEEIVNKVVTSFTSHSENAGIVHVYRKSIDINKVPVNIIIFKVPGTPEMSDLRASLYVGASGVIVVFSMSDIDSLYNALGTVDEILTLQLQGKVPDLKILLLGISDENEIINQRFLRQISNEIQIDSLVISLNNNGSIEHAFRLAIF